MTASIEFVYMLAGLKFCKRNLCCQTQNTISLSNFLHKPARNKFVFRNKLYIVDILNISDELRIKY